MPTQINTTSSMGIAHFTKHQVAENNGVTEENQKPNYEFKDLLSLPRERGWRTPFIYKFQGFWCQPNEIQAIVSFQNHFQARDSDVVLCTVPKSGTTWLKALAFATINRNLFATIKNSHPLLVSNPHDLVPFFEYKVYTNNQIPNYISALPEPRIFATHIPFASLEDSIKTSNCKIVYICRNPFDTFISSWVFLNKVKPEGLPPLSLEEAFNMYCNGVVGYGPFWDHMLGYWNQSLERADKVLFLKYEDLKQDTEFHLKKLAKFLGYPFTLEEEKGGVIEEIINLCSFEKLKDLEVNKSSKSILNFENQHLFRKGEVGDWVNYLTPSMVNQLKQVMEFKFSGSGLEFNVFSS